MNLGVVGVTVIGRKLKFVTTLLLSAACLTCMSMPVAAASFLICKFPEPMHVTGFRTHTYLIDGDRLKNEPDLSAGLPKPPGVKIVSLTETELLASSDEASPSAPTIKLDRTTGIVEMTTFGTSVRQFGVCVIVSKNPTEAND